MQDLKVTMLLKKLFQKTQGMTPIAKIVISISIFIKFEIAIFWQNGDRRSRKKDRDRLRVLGQDAYPLKVLSMEIRNE